MSTATERGFGTRMIRRGLAADLSGTVTRDFRPERASAHHRRTVAAPRAGSGVIMQAAAALRRALLVEDEVLVAMYVEDALSELGYAVAAVARNLAEALALARESQFDFAVLDINSNGEKSFPVAELLRKHQIPFMFVSGYTSGGPADNTGTKCG